MNIVTLDQNMQIPEKPKRGDLFTYDETGAVYILVELYGHNKETGNSMWVAINLEDGTWWNLRHSAESAVAELRPLNNCQITISQVIL